MADKVMQASTFKARCLALLDEVARSHRTIVVTKHGKPVAKLVLIHDKPPPTRGSATLLVEDDEAYFSTGKAGMPSADRVLLDTHALLWWQAQPDQARPERISVAAWELITAASCVLVSPISCREVGMLVGKERIQLDRAHRSMDTRHTRHRRHRSRRADAGDRGSGC